MRDKITNFGVPLLLNYFFQKEVENNYYHWHATLDISLNDGVE